MFIKRLISLAVLLCPAVALAAPVPVEVTESEITIDLTAANAGTEYVFFKPLRGSDTTLFFSVDGPAGATVQIGSHQLAKKVTLESSLTAAFKPLDMYFYDIQRRTSIALKDPNTSAASAPMFQTSGADDPDPNCNCYSANEADTQAQALHIYPAFATLTGAQWCQQIAFVYCPPRPPSECQPATPPPGYESYCPGGYDGDDDSGGGDGGSGGGGTGGGDSEPPTEFPDLHNGTVEGASFISYDYCNKKGKVYAAVHVDLTGADLTNGGKLKVTMNLKRYDYRRQASIKRSGDGKYKGALLLTAPPYANNYATGAKIGVNLVRYRGKKVSSKNVGYKDYVSYGPAGGSLLRSTVSKLLRGGKGTVEVRYGAEGYGFCAALSARDQYFNGYPRVGR